MFIQHKLHSQEKISFGRPKIVIKKNEIELRHDFQYNVANWVNKNNMGYTMNTKLGLLLLGATALIFSSCAKSKDDEPAPAFTADSDRAIGEPRFSFTSEQQEIKMSSLSRSEVAELLMCKDKSTSFRTEKKAYTVSYGMLSRSLSNGKQSVQSEKTEYKTENRDEVYELTTSLVEHSISGHNVLEGGVITYKDTCSASAGCDQEKRKFTAGSAKQLIDAKLREEAIIEDVKRQKGTSECYLKSVTEQTEQMQKGQIRLGEAMYKAVQVVGKKTGKIYCRAGASRQIYFLGEGAEVTKAVILMDELLIPSKVVPTRLSISEYGCNRTPVFASTEIQFEGQTISGTSGELVDYKLQGETMSIEVWNKKQNDIKTRISELKDDVTVKKSKQDTALLSVNEAESKLASLQSSLVSEKAKLNEAIANKKPDEDVFRKFVKDAEDAVESARASRDAAKNYHALTQSHLKNAEEALQTFIRENGTGEN